MASFCKTVRAASNLLRPCSPRRKKTNCQSSSAGVCGGSSDANKGSDAMKVKDSSTKNPSTPTLYDCRKYGHYLPMDNVCTPFEPLPCIPSGVFRCTDGEPRLGPCADKCGFYPNPEYFCYHHMSFFDLHMILQPCRNPSAKSGRKPTII